MNNRQGKNIPFHKPSIGEEDIKEVVDVLSSGWLTTGAKTKRFEEEFSRYVGSRHAVAVNSCTAALHLALSATGLKENDEVILPAMTFAASGEVVTYFGARPVLVDCDEDTLLIDPDRIEEKIGPKTKAIMPVHFGGQACDMDRITDLAEKYDLSVIEDAAHSLPASYKGRMIGTVGDITCFSFYATKTITTGEGGMLCTDNDEWAEDARIMSLHGISKDAWKRYTAEGSWYYEIVKAGFKYNLTDIAAALGLAQLKRCDEFRSRRAAVAQKYTDSFAGIPEVKPLSKRDYGTHAWHLYVIQLNLEALKLTRAQFVKDLNERGIGCSVHFIPLHLHPYYRKTFGTEANDLPVSSRVYERIVSLPIYPGMAEEDVTYVAEAVARIIRENRK